MESKSRRHKKRDSNLNTVWAGFLIGIVIPAIIFLLYWYVKFYPMIPLQDLISQRLNLKSLMQILAICALPDPVIFYFFSRLRFDNACKGMIAAILTLLVLTLVAKFV